MPRPRSENPSPAARRNREYRDRKKAGLECFILEVDIVDLSERLGFEDRERMRQFIQQMLDNELLRL